MSIAEAAITNYTMMAARTTSLLDTEQEFEIRAILNPLLTAGPSGSGGSV